MIHVTPVCFPVEKSGIYRVFMKYCVLSKILKYIPDSGLSQFPFCISTMYAMVGETPALQQNWQSSEKSEHSKEKHNI